MYVNYAGSIIMLKNQKNNEIEQEILKSSYEKVEEKKKKKFIYQEKVQQFRKEHPKGRKADCIRVTGLSKPTVYKWWDK